VCVRSGWQQWLSSRWVLLALVMGLVVGKALALF
jgi:hypothetical protein